MNVAQIRPAVFNGGMKLALGVALLLTSPLVAQTADWSAFNDQIAGTGTGANATAWGVFANSSGLLKNSATGVALPVTLTIGNVGAASTNTMAAPNAGTPAATLFAGQIAWTAGAGEGVQLDPADSVTYTFSGLDPTRRYTIRSTSARGGNYANRWTRAEITGTVSQAAAHTAGVLTAIVEPTLTVRQAAWNSGENRTGAVVGWDYIDPGADGTFAIVARRYAGAYPALGTAPGGNTETEPAPAAYSFGALRLQALAGPPPGPPNAVADSITLHAGQKAVVRVLANDTGIIDPMLPAIVTPPAAGTATVRPDGTILYTAPATAALGAVDPFSYTVSGPGGTSTAATVTATISPTLRLTPTGLNVPSAAPATSWNMVTAFPGITLAEPVCLTTPPGETQRLFVCQKAGLLRVITDVTAATPATLTFLDLAALLTSRGESLLTVGEMGLLGVAFHPSFATNRQFYLFYSVRKADGLDYERVARFTANAAAPATQTANPATEVILIEQRDEANNHNGSDLHFGPDGYLYITLGDEGNQNDSFNNSQQINKDFFSGILRIDVDKRPGNPAPNPHPSIPLTAGEAAYAVPLDNPWMPVSAGGTWNGIFNGVAVPDISAVRTEFWAVGLRNPWRMSFDPLTQELWCGDVGGGLREEIDIITKGGNYGWAYREGNSAGPKSGAPVGFTSLPPLYDYAHGSGLTEGFSITGGIVYRGTRYPGLVGKYLFADYVSGHVWSLERPATGAPIVTRLTGEGGLSAFGRDPSNGDVLAADLNNNVIRRLVTSPGNDGYPQQLSDTGVFADLADLTPAPGFLPYQVAQPFWSDNASKRRWVALTNPASTIGWTREGTWVFPNGTVWVKHFDMEMQRGVPASKKRLETRLLVRNATGAYGVSYRWNDAGTQATLAPDEGVDFPLAITENGAPRPQTWRIPGRSECMSCHNPNAGWSLSGTTRQLGIENSIHGRNGHQIDLLQAAGYFSNPPDPAATLPRHVRPEETAYSIESRARSWLAVNCAYCHQAGSGVPGAFDLRAHLTMAQTGLINGNANNNGGDVLNKLIVRGDPTHSIVLNRVAVANGFSRMPPLATNVTDPAAVALLTEWISQTTNGGIYRTYDQWAVAALSGTPALQALPQADADGDGQSNETEFLAGTDPLSGGSLFLPIPSAPSPGRIGLAFTVPENRSWQILISPNLQTWTPWLIPGNAGLPSNGGPVVIDGPVSSLRQFFQVRILGN
jgi:glucose/arabinose dehydrogenase